MASFFSPVGVGSFVRSLSSRMEKEVGRVHLFGEVSGASRSASGHAFFDLKDKEGLLPCVLFGSNLALKNGTKVEVKGSVGMYAQRGTIRLVARSVEETGEKGEEEEERGRLLSALEREGVLSRTKRSLPPFPTHLCIITSVGSAAYHDILSGIRQRWPSLRHTILDARVQGGDGVDGIVEGIERAERMDDPPVDVLILARGGGSKEDLSCFSHERVVRRIASVKRAVVVSAIGHESDSVLSDLVSDVRSKTPTASVETCVPERRRMGSDLERRRGCLIDSFLSRIVSERRSILFRKERLSSSALHSIRVEREKISRMKDPLPLLLSSIRLSSSSLSSQLVRLDNSVSSFLSSLRSDLDLYGAKLEGGEGGCLKRGYAILTSEDGLVGVRSADEARRHKVLKVRFLDGDLTVKF